MTCGSSGEQIRVRFTPMLKNMCNSLNRRVKFIADRGIALSSTLIGENLSYIRSKMIDALPLELVLQKDLFHSLISVIKTIVQLLQLMN